MIFLRLGCVIRKTTFSFGHGPEYDLDPGNFEGLLPVRYIGNAEFYLTRIMAEVFFLLVLLITEFESVIFVLCTTVPCCNSRIKRAIALGLVCFCVCIFPHDKSRRVETRITEICVHNPEEPIYSAGCDFRST